MKKTIFTLAFAVLASLSLLRAQTELFALNPQQQWWHYDCSIEKATIRVSPHGLYSEVGIYLTFESPDVIPLGDSFEIVMNFSLPEGAFMVDSWLWIGENIVRAEILDRWTASAIYEDIVQRQQDPSILTKTEYGRYELRIYPVLANENRKVKITYLVPAQWSAEEVVTTLPLHILEGSYAPVQNVKLQVKADVIWGQPHLRSLSGQQPTWTEPISGLLETTLPNGNTTIKLAMDAPLNEGVFVSTLPVEGPDYYQMAILPEAVFDFEPIEGRKLLVAIEYVNFNSPFLSKAAMLNEIKSQMLASLYPEDHFNLLVTDFLPGGQFSPHFYRPHWVQAHPDSIEAAFLALSGFSSTSNLPGMLSDGINFIQNNGNEGEFLLFANSGLVGNPNTANPYIEAIQELMGDQLIPINICDFQTYNFNYHWLGNNYYRGNEYLYTNLARISGGSYFNQIYCCQTFQSNVQQMFELQSSLPGIVEIYTDLENGFSFQRYDLSVSSGMTDLKKPILQVGRIQGNGAFRIDANMEHNGVFQSREILLTEDLSVHSDTMIQEMWAGNHLDVLEAQATTNNAIHTALQFSIAERVLGNYTAFLCLEPTLGGEICFTCEDEGGVVPTEPSPTLVETVAWTAYPNPFSDYVRVDLTLPEGLDPDDCTLVLFDATGRKIRQFQAPDLNGSGQDWQLTWDARDESGTQVPSGVYYLVLSTPNGKYQMKLVCVR
ncbi:MAG: VIT domain-containing protein [Saprospiraceae bacterium]